MENKAPSTDSHKQLLSAEQQALLENAISKAELKTSGEIRVHLERSCPENNVLDRAAQVFAELEMHKTELRNGVLFYVATDDHKFAVIGDAGINAKVSADFWDTIKVKMQTKFRAGNFCDGLLEAVNLAGTHLQQYFPFEKNDVNELSNHISFGNN